MHWDLKAESPFQLQEALRSLSHIDLSPESQRMSGWLSAEGGDGSSGAPRNHRVPTALCPPWRNQAAKRGEGESHIREYLKSMSRQAENVERMQAALVTRLGFPRGLVY